MCAGEGLIFRARRGPRPRADVGPNPRPSVEGRCDLVRVGARPQVAIGAGVSCDRLIDLHSHILPGLDDGARTIEDSRAMAREAARGGITAIAATPHVRRDFPTTVEQMERGVADLTRDFAREGIGVAVIHGSEVDLERLPALTESELRRFSLAQTGRYILLETPYLGWPLSLEHQIFELHSAGLTPVLAHPERNPEVILNVAPLVAAAEAGALIQVTAASLDGRLGRTVRRTAERLLELGIVQVLASDAHTPDIRAVGLSAAVRAIRDDGLVRYLTEDVPSAIVAGDPVPAKRPPTRPRRRLRVF
jgi:protein-tyrosine phosphatase